ncbi:hypothetical protein ACFSC6_03690 [Rufibacter sediminis]|uniref:hypothetical protein n=1 Tax=Rufibacter sediminis TaxID=2762756 RepID=UPI0036293105
MGIKHFLLWLPMIVLAFANATLRELVLIKQFSDLRAHQLSTLTLIILCALYVGFVYSKLDIQSTRQSFLIGFVWVVLTVAFEFSLGRFTNKSWAFLFQDYNLVAGRIWVVFLVCLFLLPYVFYVLRSR